MASIAVKPEMIRWAVERSGRSRDELRDDFKKLDDWERGDGAPTLRQLEKFAKATYTPFGFLFLATPPVESLPVPDYRTLGDRPMSRVSPNLMDTIVTIQERQDWMRDFAMDDGEEPLDLGGGIRMGDPPKMAAQRIRNSLGLVADWARHLPTYEAALDHLRSAVERLGILVFSSGIVGNSTRRQLDAGEFRGFVLPDPLVPSIFLNNADTKSARMFTLAHELAHVWLGEGGVFNLESLLPADFPIERFCNSVAAEFLVPEDELGRLWPELQHRFDDIARVFKCSPLVAARRCLDLKFVSRSEFHEFYEKDRERWAFLKELRKDKAGGDFYRTQRTRLGDRFSEAVVRAVRDGRMLHTDAYRVTGLHGKTFVEYSNKVRKRTGEIGG
jgi:Zn-dependent peptidase ImmA (M78 family)